MCLFPGRGGQSKWYHIIGQGQQEADQAVSHRGTQGFSGALQTEHTATLGLITPVSSGGIAKFPGTKTLPPSSLSTRLALTSPQLSKDTELGSLCPFIRASENLGLI